METIFDSRYLKDFNLVLLDGIYHPNKKKTQRIGVLPDIEVKITILGIEKRKDEV